MSVDQPLRFGNEPKLRKQMRKRRITEEMIREALSYEFDDWQGKLGPARRYRSDVTGITVLVDATTGEISHLGKAGYLYGDG